MKRILELAVQKDLKRKIILVTGPRQSGKTTLAKALSNSVDYLNFDLAENYSAIKDKNWDRKKELVIFDELHKVKNWKRWLKGIYDTEKKPPYFVVTGSAKIDTYRKMGDSLAGRYFQFRLHPLDLWELKKVGFKQSPNDTLEQLLSLSGFPEPFLENDEGFYRRWRSTHLDIILKQDLLEDHTVSSIRSLSIMIELLRNRIGSPISFRSLSEDLDYSDKTIKRWISLLEESYVLFSILPFHSNIARTQKKAPKLYFYDHAQVKDPGARLENLVANALLKQIHYRFDVKGEEWDLRYFRTKEKKEVDFLLVKDGKPQIAIEVKQSKTTFSGGFSEIKKHFPKVKKIQLVKMLSREQTYPDGTEIRSLAKWLSDMAW